MSERITSKQANADVDLSDPEVRSQSALFQSRSDGAETDRTESQISGADYALTVVETIHDEI